VPTAFVDTSAWVALMATDDKDHARALAVFRNLPPRTRLVTTNYVVAETATWLVHHNRRQAIPRYRNMISASEQQALLTTEWITKEQHEEAWSYLERYRDQVLSFCDCTSFIVCRNLDVDFVFGLDNDFRTMGFDLRPGPS
jgi:uncharacterized protein